MHAIRERPVTPMRRALVARLRILRRYCVAHVAGLTMFAQSDELEALGLLAFADECTIISRSECDALWRWVRGWRTV